MHTATVCPGAGKDCSSSEQVKAGRRRLGRRDGDSNWRSWFSTTRGKGADKQHRGPENEVRKHASAQAAGQSSDTEASAERNVMTVGEQKRARADKERGPTRWGRRGGAREVPARLEHLRARVELVDAACARHLEAEHALVLGRDLGKRVDERNLLLDGLRLLSHARATHTRRGGVCERERARKRSRAGKMGGEAGWEREEGKVGEEARAMLRRKREN
eukprot:3526517-Pleurochrysis_carterae.AAC.3